MVATLLARKRTQDAAVVPQWLTNQPLWLILVALAATRVAPIKVEHSLLHLLEPRFIAIQADLVK